MPYSIFVRAIDSSRRSAPEILACEIENEGEASRIVHGLASSYGEFGLDTRRSVYWFRSPRGLHEIWSAASD
ncbi:hypothetical protein ASF28_11405 [Methylobacterium sp. Leaf99]|jgi:hypothetical protein|uniref:hypothetical protein n=1 Tax=Methylobacterium sp. Leaf99 TaxID=1736251 RepID=UPI0006F7A511|nr:hypothetical protein [Methylobacterium sp. Leaf99]KQP07726.1 hypothetical protein ASF28_11405 [Methylobacterium sp. Leaf99]